MSNEFKEVFSSQEHGNNGLKSKSNPHCGFTSERKQNFFYQGLEDYKAKHSLDSTNEMGYFCFWSLKL